MFNHIGALFKFQIQTFLIIVHGPHGPHRHDSAVLRQGRPCHDAVAAFLGHMLPFHVFLSDERLWLYGGRRRGEGCSVHDGGKQGNEGEEPKAFHDRTTTPHCFFVAKKGIDGGFGL